LHPDKNTILLGHSRGGVAVLRYLERLSKDAKVKKVILLAANSGSAKYMAIPTESNMGFYTKEGYDFAKIKSHCSNFVAFHSEDDPWVPFEHGKENAEGLNAKFITFKDKKHFGKNDGIIPGLIEEVTNITS
jgi:serine hydrolase